MTRRRWLAASALTLAVGTTAVVQAQAPETDRQALDRICKILVQQKVATACVPVPTSSTSTSSSTSSTSTTTTTTAPTTTSTSTTTTQPPPTTTTTLPTGTPLNPSMNVAQIVASAPQGTSFTLAPGIYKRVTINPRDGQAFNCQPGAIFDGENVAAYAFRSSTSPAPNNVTIRGCEIKNYMPVETFGWNEGAITSIWYGDQGGGENWLVENANIHHNRGAGVMLSDEGTVRNSNIHHNYSIGVKLYWAPDGGLIEGNEIAYNNFDAPPDFNETGGTKFAWTTDLVVQDNYVHHNRGPGLWTDIDNVNTVYDGNRVEFNDGPGITHEVSFSASITNNTVVSNGHGAQGSPGDSWMWGAGILVANSGPALIEGNTLTGNDSGIGFIQQNRVEDYGSGAFAYQTSGTVLRNTTTGPGWTGAVQDIGNTNYFAGRVTFEENIYINSTWVFGGSVLTFTQWKALGHDN